MLSNNKLRHFIGILTPRLLLTVVVFIVMLISFVFITNHIIIGNNTHFDRIAFEIISAFQSPAITKLFTAITFLGSGTFLLPAYIIVILFFTGFSHNLRRSLKIIITGLSSTALLFSAKNYFHRLRPQNPLIENVSGYSFPSGHSFSSFIFCGILIYIIVKSYIYYPLKLILSGLVFLLAFLVALSRVYLRVHYASDVIAGFCLSIIWLTFSFAVLKVVLPKKEIPAVV